MEIRRSESGRGVQAQDLRAIRLDDLIETVVAESSSTRFHTMDDGEVIAYYDAEPDRDAVKAVRAMRRAAHRKVDAKHLKKVADLYRLHAEAGKPVEAVERAYGRSYRSAARWVQRARQEGLL